MDIDTAGENFFFEAKGNVEILGFSLFIQDGGTNDALDFGAISGLSNGLRLYYEVSGSDYEVFNLKTNYQIGLLFNKHSVLGNSNEEASGFWDSVNLRSGDKFIARVRDNLTNVAYLRMAVHIRGVL